MNNIGQKKENFSFSIIINKKTEIPILKSTLNHLGVFNTLM